MFEIVKGTMLNVSGDIEDMETVAKMGWGGLYMHGFFIREFDDTTEDTIKYHGGTDEDGEPVALDGPEEAAKLWSEMAGETISHHYRFGQLYFYRIPGDNQS